MRLHMHKAMGLVADIFTEDVLSKLRGTLRSVIRDIPLQATRRC